MMAMAVASALVAGYAMAQRRSRSVLHGLLYAAAVSLTVFTVLDLDDPRVGLITLDSSAAVLRQLHDSIR
jgi:hypothetical protein